MFIGVLIGMALMAPLTLISMIGWFRGGQDGHQRAERERRTATRTAAERRARRRLGL